MNTKLKEQYEAPEVLVFEVKTEGLICASSGDGGLNDYNNGGNQGW